MDRVAVVTGASAGIGAEIARGLARKGWHCVLLARREDRLRPVAEETGGEMEICDVSDRAAVDAVAARVLDRHPLVHLLVNNAGIPARAGFLDGDPQAIEDVIRTNYLGGVWCLRAFLSGLERAAPSDVVNIVSVAGDVAFPPLGPVLGLEARPACVLARHGGPAPSEANTRPHRQAGIRGDGRLPAGVAALGRAAAGDQARGRRPPCPRFARARPRRDERPALLRGRRAAPGIHTEYIRPGSRILSPRGVISVREQPDARDRGRHRRGRVSRCAADLHARERARRAAVGAHAAALPAAAHDQGRTRPQ